VNENSKFTYSRVEMDIQMRFDPLPGLTPEILSTRLRDFGQGFLGPLARTMDRMETLDDTIQCVAPKRKTGLAKYNYQILTVPNLPYGKKREAEQHKATLEYFYNNLTCTSAVEQNAVRGFSYLVETMLDAIGKKYSVHNIIWKPSDDGISADFVHGPLWFFENRTGKLRFLETNAAWNGVDIDPSEWLVTVGQGLMQACAVAWMFIRLPLRDWLIFSQDYSRHPVEGITDAAQGTPEWNDVEAAVKAYAAGLKVVHNRSAEFKVGDAITGTGDMPYPALVERMSRAIVALWRGADLGTMSAGDGEGQGASLQGEETYNLECSDGKLVSETLNAQVDKRVIGYVHGPDTKPLAYLQIVIPPKQNIQQDILIDSFLRDSGASLGEEEALERYGRSAADEGEKILGKKPADKKPPVIEAANEKSAPDDPNEKLVRAALDQAFAIIPKWLAPLQPFFSDLERNVQSLGTTDDILTYLEGKVALLPTLLPQMDYQSLATILEAAMGSSVLTGLENSLQQTDAVNELSFAAPTSLTDAIELLDAKTPVGSILRSRDWLRVPLALRQRAQFSAGVESIKVLQRIQDSLSAAINLEREAQRADGTSPGIYKMDRQKFIADIRELAMREGLLPIEDEKIGTLQDITSEIRLDLIFRTQMGMAQGFAFWKRGMNTDILDGWPAQEFVRIRAVRVPRDWDPRWIDAAQAVGDEGALYVFQKWGLMVALKTSEIWTALSVFGTPWAPFDFNSGKGLAERDREAAVKLGLIGPDQLLEPIDKSFNERLQESAKNLSQRSKDALATLFGDQIEFVDDLVKWKGVIE
jgi:phage gp29-like protein